MNKRARNLLVFTLILSVIAAVVIAIAVSRVNRLNQRPQTAVNLNRLAIGAGGAAEAIDIPIRVPEEFDGLSRNQIYDLRRQAVREYPALLAATYEPYEEIFGGIEDGLPWWGMQGLFYYGSGEYSIEGASEESRYILNPYLLVAPEFYGLSYIGNGNFAWRNNITDDMLNAPDFPLTCMPQALRWYPSEARAEVTYDITACIAAMNAYIVIPMTAANVSFDLTTYNARDFNLNYYRIRNDDSVVPDIGFPFLINHFLHDVNNCGASSRCNNRSPFYIGTGDYFLTALPGSFTVNLWEQEPERDTPPDMIFTIRFV